MQILNGLFHSVYGSYSPARQGILGHGYGHVDQHFRAIKALSTSKTHSYADIFLMWATHAFEGYQQAPFIDAETRYKGTASLP
jgi:hypothetical protein